MHNDGGAVSIAVQTPGPSGGMSQQFGSNQEQFYVTATNMVAPSTSTAVEQFAGADTLVDSPQGSQNVPQGAMNMPPSSSTLVQPGSNQGTGTNRSVGNLTYVNPDSGSTDTTMVANQGNPNVRGRAEGNNLLQNHVQVREQSNKIEVGSLSSPVVNNELSIPVTSSTEYNTPSFRSTT